MWKFAVRFLLISCAVLLLPVILAAIDIYTFPREKSPENADAAIVLGAAIWTDKPSPVLRERLNHAVNLYKNGQVKKIILTGGFGEKEKFAESEIGEKYLSENGVPPNDIFKETESVSTYRNLKYSVPIVEENNFKTVLIVSDPLHLRRSVKMAHDLGLNAYPAPTPTTRYESFSAQMNFLFREVYFYLKYLIVGSD